jgi:carbamoyl-phosphate synthase large subunit
MVASIPCTAAPSPWTVVMQGMFAITAAVQGLEAMRRGDIGVRSLQDWAALLRGEEPA